MTARRSFVPGRILQSSNTSTAAVDATSQHTAYPLYWPTQFNGSQPNVNAEGRTTAVCLQLDLGVCVSILLRVLTVPYSQ